MRKNEIPKAKDNDIITEYVLKYSFLTVNFNAGLGTKQLEKQCENLEAELLKRGILTEENLHRLHS